MFARTERLFHAIATKPPASDSIYEPPDVTEPEPAPVPIAVTDLDRALIAIIEAPLHHGETAQAGFARKEHEIGVVLAVLTVGDSRNLFARLSRSVAHDPLATAFNRLTAERRARLLTFLADARGREAILAARRT